MDLELFGRGLLLGFSIAAVVGPIALLCLRRTLASGFAVGFVSGLGAASADATYALVAGVGVQAVAAVLVDQRTALRLVGGAFLLYLGLRTLRAQPAADSAVETRSGRRLAAAYTSTLALTLSNPTTILSFAAIFAGLGLGSLGATSLGSAVLLVSGVFVGSSLWWLVLASVAARLRAYFSPPRLRTVNIASGLLIVGFGVQALASAFGASGR
jgi:threonine/homoserine/homoserine lactone efflux protein